MTPLGGQNHIPASIDLDDIETCREAALRQGLSVKTIFAWIAAGDLTPLHAGIKPMFLLRDDVDEIAAQKLTARRNSKRHADLQRAHAAWRKLDIDSDASGTPVPSADLLG